jgi:hypothetical protein
MLHQTPVQNGSCGFAPARTLPFWRPAALPCPRKWVLRVFRPYSGWLWVHRLQGARCSKWHKSRPLRMLLLAAVARLPVEAKHLQCSIHEGGEGKLFGNTLGAARRRYRKYVQEGLPRGRRPDMVGGGLLRSVGGWKGLKALADAGIG